ncbi:hypothetical protein RND71_019198 [Anisodus tanguticus]|uniref:Uncharacterized protein n=1 Tax=Anisodus tanguticus TaxID=243964 RepID=A0AAE1S0G8_9SOLA|nr:hypothetical protein RND71_019198 [Anisodus tanguticus]
MKGVLRVKMVQERRTKRNCSNYVRRFGRLIQNKQPEQQNQNIPGIGFPRQHNIPEMGQPRQQNFIPVTGLNVKTLEALDERIRNDIELVLNSKACLNGTKWEVDYKSVDLYQQSFGLSLKLLTLVREKEKSPELA